MQSIQLTVDAHIDNLNSDKEALRHWDNKTPYSA